MADESETTEILRRALDGDDLARETVFNRLYDDLRNMAAGLMCSERTGHSWSETDLVHECFLALFIDHPPRSVPNRTYFFGAVCTTMKRLLADHARKRKCVKRGGDRKRSAMEECLDRCERQGIDPVELSDALDQLRSLNARQCEVVQLRFYCGFEISEIAAALGIGESTVRKDFVKARSELFGLLQDD